MVPVEPKITILLAAFNREDLIKETLESILAQTYTNWECLITDDRSTDGTPNIVKDFMRKDNRFFYYIKPGSYPAGLSGTRNFGLDLAKERKARYIQFFDDDDIMYPRKLELQMQPFKEDPNLHFTVCKFEKLVETNNGEPEVYRPELKLNFDHVGDAMLTGEFKMNSLSGLWNMNILEKFRFDERLRYAEEWELFIRIGYHYPGNYAIVDEFLFGYRKHRETLTLGKDESYERRKSSAVSRLILVDYLTRNDLHTKTSIIFFTRTFLTYQYKPDIVRNLLWYVKETGRFSNKLQWFLENGIRLSNLHFRILGKISTWV